ncbi:hypothetical protein ATANTOWER_015759 [Ataeniobius toweri]|uniref:Uncharacterized protein n=1 Tax=Ataeniobius toweri TaxID=208326 RepID=A0ABU7AUE8_9TELE|nr:hypothetical protein [Ataeniobius toweri]
MLEGSEARARIGSARKGRDGRKHQQQQTDQSPAEPRTADERSKACIVFPQRLSSKQRPAARNLSENDAQSGPPPRGARRHQSRIPEALLDWMENICKHLGRSNYYDLM